MNLQMLEGSNKVLHLTLKRAGQKLTTNPRPPFRAGKNNRLIEKRLKTLGADGS